jgi:hypothetical protein
MGCADEYLVVFGGEGPRCQPLGDSWLFSTRRNKWFTAACGMKARPGLPHQTRYVTTAWIVSSHET